jgi:hypothetical protein
MSFGSWLQGAVKSVSGLVQQVQGAAGTIAQVAGAAGVKIDLGPVTATVEAIKTTAGPIVDHVTHLANQAGPLLHNPIIAEARKIVPPDGLRGFDAAIVVLQHPVDEATLQRVRDSLTGAEKQAFDTALAAQIGMAQHAIPAGDPATQAAYAVTKGVQGGTADQKAVLVESVALTDAGAAGATAAMKHTVKENAAWWVRMANWFSE